MEEDETQKITTILPSASNAGTSQSPSSSELEFKSSDAPNTTLSRHGTRLQRVKSRVSSHISEFFTIICQIGATRCEVLIDRTLTIEKLAHQIEAVFNRDQWQKNQGGDGGGEAPDGGDDELELLEVTQIFDSGMMVLSFTDVIEDRLKDRDVVHVVPMDDESVENLIPFSGPQRHSTMGRRTLNASGEPTLDDRFQMLLRNTHGIQALFEFCAQEYNLENLLFWLELETLRFAEPKYRPMLCKYIHLTYMVLGSPLRVNLCSEFYEELDLVFKNGNATKFDIFDDVQDHVYAIIKRHSFVRFEKSPIFQRLVEFKSTEKQKYLEGKMTDNYLQHFSINYDSIGDITSMLESPLSLESKAAMEKLTGTNLVGFGSNTLKELILQAIISQYFKDTAFARGYFDAAGRIQWTAKQKKMNKEKKLAKFFGSRPSDDHMKRQVARRISLQYHDHSPAESSSRLNQEEEFDSNEASPNRLKKAEKLKMFFGDNLPNPERIGQRLANGEDIVITGEEDSESSDTASSIEIDTLNELDAAQKRLLNKRNKKLTMILGETLKQEVISNVVVSVKKNSLTSEYEEDINEFVENDIESETNQSDGKLEARTAMKKRVNKLTSVLGERVNITKTVDDIDESDGPEISTMVGMSARNSVSAASTYSMDKSELDSEARKLLNKKGRKISSLLGQTLDKSIAAKIADDFSVSQQPNKDDEEVGQLVSAIRADKAEADSDDEDTQAKLAAVKRRSKIISITGERSSVCMDGSFSIENYKLKGGSKRTSAYNEVPRQVSDSSSPMTEDSSQGNETPNGTTRLIESTL